MPREPVKFCTFTFILEPDDELHVNTLYKGDELQKAGVGEDMAEVCFISAMRVKKIVAAALSNITEEDFGEHLGEPEAAVAGKGGH